MFSIYRPKEQKAKTESKINWEEEEGQEVKEEGVRASEREKQEEEEEEGSSFERRGRRGGGRRGRRGGRVDGRGEAREKPQERASVEWEEGEEDWGRRRGRRGGRVRGRRVEDSERKQEFGASEKKQTAEENIWGRTHEETVETKDRKEKTEVRTGKNEQQRSENVHLPDTSMPLVPNSRVTDEKQTDAQKHATNTESAKAEDSAVSSQPRETAAREQRVFQSMIFSLDQDNKLIVSPFAKPPSSQGRGRGRGRGLKEKQTSSKVGMQASERAGRNTRGGNKMAQSEKEQFSDAMTENEGEAASVPLPVAHSKPKRYSSRRQQQKGAEKQPWLAIGVCVSVCACVFIHACIAYVCAHAYVGVCVCVCV